MEMFSDTYIELFPACAGVILPDFFTSVATPSFPRMCGGDPASGTTPTFETRFSPHVRG